MGSTQLQYELEKKLVEAGEKLLINSFSCIVELLIHLDKAEHFLSLVGQNPPESMEEALIPLKEALIARELLSHSEVEVRVSVASCLNELTRITAPVGPYNTEVMKEIFQLNVMAFGRLGQTSGRCYTKACQILDCVANVRSFLLMQDLGCEALIIEMFEKFVKTIGAAHPKAVLLNMEIIMTMVIKESGDPAKLLHFLISCIKKENQGDSSVSCKLAEEVLKNCADILRTNLPAVMKYDILDPDCYAKVFRLINQHIPGTEPLSKVHINLMEDEMKEKNVGVPRKRIRKPSSLLKPEWGYGGSLPVRKDQETSHQNDKKKRISIGNELREKSKAASKSGLYRSSTHGVFSFKKTLESTCRASNVVTEQEVPIHRDSKGATEPLLQQVITKNHSKSSSMKSAAEGYHDKSSIDCRKRPRVKKYGEALVGCRIKVWWPNDHRFYEGRVSSFDPLEKKHKVLYDDGDVEALDLCVEHWKQVVDTPPAPVSCSILPLSVKDRHVKEYDEELVGCRIKVWWPTDRRFYEGLVSSFDSLEKKHKVLYDDGDEETLNLCAERWKLVGDATAAPVSGLARSVKKYGEELVGCRIKVWWPIDNRFYEGCVSSFDPSGKNHKVVYDDGDVETLDLCVQRWELVVDTPPAPEQDTNLQKSALLPENGTKKKEKREPVSLLENEPSFLRPKSSTLVSRNGADRNDTIEDSDDKLEPRNTKQLPYRITRSSHLQLRRDIGNGNLQDSAT